MAGWAVARGATADGPAGVDGFDGESAIAATPDAQNRTSVIPAVAARRQAVRRFVAGIGAGQGSTVSMTCDCSRTRHPGPPSSSARLSITAWAMSQRR